MKPWIISIQTDLTKEDLYDELIKLRERLKIHGFHIENYDEEAPQ